jgi:soluble lytic murein transglycosylase
MPQIPRFLTAIILLACVCAVPAKTDPLAAQRQLFIEARMSLNNNQRERYRDLAGRLQDYPLYAYLQFEELRTRLSRAGEAEIMEFLNTYPDHPLNSRLRQAWLYSLARNQRWEQFLKHYQPSKSVSLQCYALQARLATGRKQSLASDILPLWLVGDSQPSACDPLFEFLSDEGEITDELLWQRIRLAMQNNRPSLAGYLARRLPDKERDWVTLWRKAHSNPSSTLNDARLDRDSPLAREIIVHALRRLARFNAEQAHETWEAIGTNYGFSDAQRQSVENRIALSGATQHHPDAHDWLDALPAENHDELTREWRIRRAIAARDWDAVLDHIITLPVEERQTDEWDYWHAYALAQDGRRPAAITGYSWLAKERSYHGFLAADTLDWPYEMGDEPLTYDPAALQQLGQTPAMVRARELYLADLMTDARREWAHATRTMGNEELKLAALLAHEWGWNDRAIFTVARTGDYADLKLRFPLNHVDEVRNQARHNRLDPSHVFAVIRQESAFNKDARSPAGALGLMQLMPKTGRVTARKNRIPLSGNRNLFEAEKNIRIGSAYLREVMDRFDENTVLATAAYNAGPHRVQNWLPEDDDESAASWIANIPFSETRKYVQRVLTYAAIYDWRMEQPVTKLNQRMQGILGAARLEDTGS